MKKHYKKWLFALVVIIYLLSYLPFSIGGRRIAANHGGNHWTYWWGPIYLVEPYGAPSSRQREQFTWLGMIYIPCIVLDRCFWHTSKGHPIPIH